MWANFVIDDDREELLERRLSEKVAARVESQIKRRYILIIVAVAAVAGVFGWSITGQVTAIQKNIDSASKSLTDFTNQLDPIKLQVDRLEELSLNFSGLESEAAALEERIERAKLEQENFLRRQSEIVARNVGATLDLRRPDAADFFEQWNEFAKENDFVELEVYLLSKLAQNRAHIRDIPGAKLFFNEAESRAESLSVVAKLDVLLLRAVTETDHDLKTAALTTLKQRALDLVDEKDFYNLGRIWREIGNSYQIFGDDDLALDAFETAAEYFMDADRQDLAAEMYRRLGDIWLQTGIENDAHRNAAISAFTSAAEMADYSNDAWEEHFSHVNLAGLHDAAGNRKLHRLSICAAAEAAGRHPGLRERIDVVRRLTGDETATFEEYCP